MKSEELENQLKESLISTDQQKDSRHQRTIFPQRNIVNGDSIISNLFFTWIGPLLSYGAKWPIQVQHMPTLPKQYQTKFQSENLLNIFQETERSPTQGFTLSKALFKAYIKQYFLIILFLIIYVGLSMFSPFLTSMVMEYIGQDEQNKDYSYGWFLFILTLLTTFVKNLSQTQMSFKFSLLGLNMTNSLTMMIYNKSLRYGSICQKKFTESDIVNYSQVDAERMTYMGFQLSSLLFAPLQIIIGIIMMYKFIGISFLSGMATMAFTISITYFIAKKSIKYNEQMLKVKDQRMKATQQMLDIIRFIKINAIQKFFFSKVNQKRMKEISLYKKKGFMDVLNIFVYWLACPLILSATFFTYIKLGNEMSSQVAFTTIMIFSILQYPIRLLPTCISEIIQMFASVKRIQKFLLAEERKTLNIVHIIDDDSPVAIRIERGDFYWGLQQNKEEKEGEKKDKAKNKNQDNSKKSQQNQIVSIQQENKSESNLGEDNQNRQIQTFSAEQIEELPPVQPSADAPKYVHVLKDINTTISKQKFTIVIGDIGSGKSSLLFAILNEMRSSKKSKIQINGEIAYASQKPWIMSASVKDNIIFTLPYDDARFNKVIHYASLSQDIKILPNGVQTEIGQKGVNLSGGQKARIGLARALYSQKNIYLLDDILSAVDVHVGQFLMRQTLLGYLKGKTIIMPTHAIKFAEFVDEIIIMSKGKIVRKGHYKDISQTPQFIEINLNEKKKSQSEKEQSQLKDEKQLQNEMIKLKQVIKTKSSNNKEAKQVNDQIVQQLMLPQDHTVGKIDLAIFKEYIVLNGGYFRFAFLVCFAMLLWIISTTMASIIMQRLCEDPIGEQRDLYIYMSLAIFSNLFILFRAYTLVLSGAKQGQKVHKSMIKSLLYASLNNFYNRVPVGRIINRLTKDLRELDEAIGFAIGSLLVTFFTLLSTLTICVDSSTPWVLIPITIVLYFSNRLKDYYMKTQRQVGRYEKSTNSPIVSGFMSAISGLSVIRAYNNQQGFTNIQFNYIDINKKVRFNKSALESWFSLILTYLSFFVNMTAIGYCILSSNDNPSLAGLLMNYAINLSGDISYLILSFAYFQTKIISLQRIYTFMKISPQPAYAQYCLNWTHQEQGYSSVISRGQIQFKNAYIKYRKDLPPVLKDINCKIRPGEKIGIVGRTGAGKTTIINTLLRVTQLCGGDVLIDGSSLFQMQLKNLRNGITMIDQEPILIKSTFKTNLDLTGRYSDDQLLTILKQCNLYETVLEKGGLEGQVSNDSLSVGQKQLLCICRAFLKQSKIVLIDEATANIDLKNDEIIQKVITQKFKDCTVLTIAHRLSTLKNADRIMVMENGQILQMGSPEQLENLPNGYYKQMLKKNASQFLM